MNDATWLSELKTAGTEFASTFPNYDNNLAPVILVPSQTTVAAISF
jgi:hypothetical protein